MGNEGQRKPKRVRVHGRIRWKVEFRKDGRRTRAFFATLEEAQAAAAADAADRASFGWTVAAWSPAERAAIAAAVDELRAAGASIHDAMHAWREHRTAPRTPRTSPILRDARTEFLRAKQTASRRPRYLQELAHVLDLLRPHHGERVSSITPADLQGILDERKAAAWTARGVISKWRGFFGWCQRRGYCTENPAAALDMPSLEDRPPCILTPGSLRRLLEGAQKHAPDLIAYLALQAWGGIRPAEVDRLTWADLGAEVVSIEGRASKTRSRRLVPILHPLGEWLAIAPRKGSGPRPPGFRAAWARLRAAVPVAWGHDILRHSFVSYHLQRFGDAGRTALIAGHRQDVLFAHYRERVTDEAAADWWSIRPAADPVPVPPSPNPG